MVAIAAWSASLALVVSSTTLRGKLFWFAVLLPTTAYLAISWTLFAVTYTGREEWITRPRLAVLALSPIPWLVLTLTTDAHGLVLVAPRLDASGGFVQLAYDWGPVVWLYVACGYALLAVGNSLLFWKFLHSRNVYRKYSFSMFVGSVSLWFATIPSFAGLSPLPHLMLLPMGFLVVGVVSVAFLYSVKFVKLVPMDQILGRFSARFESLLPLARDYIVEELDSGVIVLDVEDRIVDINPMGRTDTRRRPAGRRPAHLRRGRPRCGALGVRPRRRTDGVHQRRVGFDPERPALFRHHGVAPHGQLRRAGGSGRARLRHHRPEAPRGGPRGTGGRTRGPEAGPPATDPEA
jgi:hypothetical protein